MGIVECKDQQTGRVWAAVYSQGPHVSIGAKDWHEAKEIHELFGGGERNVRLDTALGLTLDEIPTANELGGGFGVDPDKYAKLIGAGVVEAAKGWIG
jgi:hypothetical protein